MFDGCMYFDTDDGLFSPILNKQYTMVHSLQDHLKEDAQMATTNFTLTRTVTDDNTLA